MTHSVDLYVGGKIRERRILLGHTQSNLGKSIDVSLQQIQKYESGVNRVSASKLWLISRVQGAGIGYYFPRLGQRIHVYDASPQDALDLNTLRMLVIFRSVPQNKREALWDLVKELADQPTKENDKHEVD